MTYTTKQVGSKYSKNFKVYLLKDGDIISPFHDVPFKNGELVNCVNEIPRFEHAKFEILKEETFNPIVQDIKNEKVRFVKNIFPTFGYPFNYGAIPQTWEDPTVEDGECKAVGDNDPIDVVEIGAKSKRIGEVYQAKILGALALLDDDETDWKIVVIDSKDENADKLNDIEDVKAHFPGLLDFMFKWFRDYKVPDGKSRNVFALGGKFMNSSFAKNVVEKAHESWKKLILNGHGKIKIENKSFKESQGFSSHAFVVDGNAQEDSEKPEDIFTPYYVDK
ncbi:Inorganic pyrophosphatase [Glugoides intestinalis]